ncbi:GntR family transcriptional regulator [Cryobacterium sp. PAMC25264]|uniref:GntR family transcriptional regulator n=1 Tax=Cryobacterium sp. PAMC25264 TaxID=2861288 RepID=UPI001C63707C|nr:GntR family transcriptional regulator [Cryobacterium sp. PAMC25264]QYF72374.1 GntR family transcriptional regulator [Cryobacterium sp. PAMC25264]
MLFRVDQASSVSLADQLAVQVRAAVADGSLPPGTRLPPARELASALDINMHTVLRAYKRLRDDGLLEMRQGRGAWVRADAGAGTVRLAELADALLAEARKLGVTLPDVLTLIQTRG